MDATARKSMLDRVNAAVGIASVDDGVEHGSWRLQYGFVKRRRASSGQGPSISELIAERVARRASLAVDSMTFWCRVLILRVLSGQPWYYFSCAICQCKKGVRKIGNLFICSSCEDVCELPTPRYRLQLEVTNGSSNVVVTLFDEVAERLINKSARELLPSCIDDRDLFALPSEIRDLHNTYHVMELKSHTYYHHGSHESFSCSAIIKPVPGMKLGIVSLDAFGVKAADGNNLSDVLPRVTGQLGLCTVDHQSLESADPSLTQLLLMVRRHLNKGAQLHNNSQPLAFLNAFDPTLSQLLYLGRDQDKNNKEVFIKNIRVGTTWCYLACNVCKSNEGVSAVGGVLWCGVCATICQVPTIRYRLEMEVSNGKSSIIAIFHNAQAECLVKETALNLLPDFEISSDFYEIPPEIRNISNTHHILEFKTNTYIDHGDYESFVCNRVITTRGAIEMPMNESVEDVISDHKLVPKPFSANSRCGQESGSCSGSKKRTLIEASEEE